jgi:hypothetical protein
MQEKADPFRSDLPDLQVLIFVGFWKRPVNEDLPDAQF